MPLQDAIDVAGSAPILERCEKAEAKRNAKWKKYQDYRKLLEQKDVDAVIVGTTDHGRVLPAIHACQAGKDVYGEKPLTLYIAEGRRLVEAARAHKTVFQVGSQQRSMAMDKLACDFVRTGGLGKLKVVQGVNYSSAKKYTGTGAARSRVVELGRVGQSDAHASVQQEPAVRLDGVGHLLGRRDDELGRARARHDPVRARHVHHRSGGTLSLNDGPKGALGFRYANGVEVRLDQPQGGDLMGGAIFIGEKGKIEIIRNNFKTDPPHMIKELPPPEEVQKWRDEVALWQANFHMENWLDCVRSRQTPIADVEIGHRSISVAHLANITRKLNRKLAWDPAKEQFVGDAEANTYVSRPRRAGYELPKSV